MKAHIIWDLDLHNGLQEVIRIPKKFETGQGYALRILDDGTVHISATITPPAAISEPHLDQGGSGTLLIQVHGQKLFVVWPPTPRNLEWFCPLHGLRRGAIFEQALDNLDDPYCLILEQGKHATLRPGYIHGVLSATNSAVARVPFVHRDLWEEAKCVLQWELKLAETRDKGTSEERETVGGIIDGIDADKKLWVFLPMDDISTEFWHRQFEAELSWS